MKKIVFATIILISLISCKKVSMSPGCYHCMDNLGNDNGGPCGSTRDAAVQSAIGGDINGETITSQAVLDKYCTWKPQ